MGAQEVRGGSQCQLRSTSDRHNFKSHRKLGRGSTTTFTTTTTTLCWTICLVLMFFVDTSFCYRLEEDEDISTNELLPPLPSSYSASTNNHHSKNIKVFYQSGVSSNDFQCHCIYCILYYYITGVVKVRPRDHLLPLPRQFHKIHKKLFAWIMYIKCPGVV